VKATSQADATKSASASVTILAGVSIALTPLKANLAVGEQLQFNAQVSGTSSIQWKVSGSNCSGAACGTVSSTGLYTAPSAAPAGAVQVTATATANASSSASATLSILATDAAKLNGTYVMQFRGFDADGPYQSAALFTADGKGSIQNGIQDVNRNSGPSSSTFTGTYTVGSDNRGVLSITGSDGSRSLAFSLNLTGTFAGVIDSGSAGIRGSGSLSLQTAADYSTGISGTFVVGLDGSNNASARVGAAGAVFLDGSGHITGSAIDVNDGGTLLPTVINFLGTYSLTKNGHGAAILNVPGFEGGTFHFALYAISTSQVAMVSTDARSAESPLLAGALFEQSGSPFSSASLQGNTVCNLTGVSASMADVLIGQIAFDGKGTAAVTYDENDGGLITTLGKLSGAYNVSLNGRTTLNLVNAGTQVRTNLLAYVYGVNQAVLLDTGSAVRTGGLQSQVLAAPISTADFLGPFGLSSGEMVASGAELTSGAYALDGAGSFSGKIDTSAASGFSPNVAANGTYSIASSTRGTISRAAPSAQKLAFWPLSNGAVIAVDVDPSNTNPVVQTLSQ
jgi:hypothetical protein